MKFALQCRRKHQSRWLTWSRRPYREHINGDLFKMKDRYSYDDILWEYRVVMTTAHDDNWGDPRGRLVDQEGR